jgi:hypothetical protein
LNSGCRCSPVRGLQAEPKSMIQRLTTELFQLQAAEASY